MSEFDEDERFTTPFTRKDGSVATVFSSAKQKTVNRHFKWMNDYNIDGVFVQRFAVNINQNVTPKLKANEDVVINNCINGAINNNNKLISIMYDITGTNSNNVVDNVKNDWKELVEKHQLNDSNNPYILTYKQKPIVAIWGVGFLDREYTLDNIQELVNFFKHDPVYGGCSVLLGVPSRWRTLDGDALTNTQLHNLIKCLLTLLECVTL